MNIDWDLFEALVEQLREPPEAIERRVQLSTELFNLTGQRYGSDYRAWQGWAQLQRTKIQHAKDAAAGKPMQALALEPLYQKLSALGLIDVPTAVQQKPPEEADQRALARDLLFRYGQAELRFELPDRPDLYTERIARSVAYATNWALEISVPYASGAWHVKWGEKRLEVESHFQAATAKLVSEWAAEQRRSLWFAREEGDSLDRSRWWGWLLNDAQLQYISGEDVLALRSYDEIAANLEDAETRVIAQLQETDPVLGVVGYKHATQIRSGTGNDTHAMASLVRDLGGICDGALDEVEVRPAGKGFELRQGAKRARVKELGNDGWLEPLLPVVSKLAAGNPEKRRFYWDHNDPGLVVFGTRQQARRLLEMGRLPRGALPRWWQALLLRWR